MLSRVLIALFLLSCAAFAQSPNQSVVEQPATQNTKQDGSAQKDAAAQPPIIVNIIPAQKTETDRAEEAKDRRDKAETDAKLAEYTGQLADFTRLLFYATVVLGVATVGLFVLGFCQSRDVKASVKAAKISAAATVKQANVATHVLTNIERPYLFISDVNRLEIERLEYFDQEIGEWSELQFTLTYSVTNHGKIPAIIKNVRVGLQVGEKPRKPDKAEATHTLVMAPTLASGASRPKIRVRISWEKYSDDLGEIVPEFGDNRSLFFYMLIEYRGPFTNDHETSACWLYNENTWSFIGPWGGPEYNYEK